MPHINHDYNGRYNTIDYESSINLGYAITLARYSLMNWSGFLITKLSDLSLLTFSSSNCFLLIAHASLFLLFFKITSGM